jgi:sugar phosphate isomerase/epimerase
MCRRNGLTILTLNPLKWFEGNLNTPFDERLAQAKEWIELASLMGTPIIQMPSQFLSNSTGDESVIIPELQWFADEGAKRSIIFDYSYEGLAFAQHNTRWQDAPSRKCRESS